ncbi:hypothetical protein AB0876_19210 [Mycobacterium sp. NPDC049093]
MKVFYDPSYVVSEYGFDTTRKSGWIANSLAARPIAGIDLVSPQPLTTADIELVHDCRYVDAVRTGSPRDLAEAQGFGWDPGLWDMVCGSNGGVLAAARAALTDNVAGSLSSGLHHAKYGRGEGFCTFNGLVIAAKKLLAEGAVSSVLILDFDAHCGGGTAELIAEDQHITQHDVSVSVFDWYEVTANSALTEVTSADNYLPSIRRALHTAAQDRPFDLCLYNAGMDPYEGCSVGGLAGITAQMIAEREHLVFDWCRCRRIPVCFVLAGGYVGPRLTESVLVNLHRQTIASAQTCESPRAARCG